MVIEFTNAKTHPHRSSAATFVVICASIFLFIPTTIIVLGYYVSQPVGNLISPLPQGVISESVTPTVTAPIMTDNQPIIAAPSDSTPSSISQSIEGNSTDKSISLLANTSEVIVEDSLITEDSQILLIPNEADKSIYYVKSKSNGKFTISTATPSNMDRVIDYQIVSP